MKFYAICALLIPLIAVVYADEQDKIRDLGGGKNPVQNCGYRQYYADWYGGNQKACEFYEVKYGSLTKAEAKRCCSEQGCCWCSPQPTLKQINACNPKLNKGPYCDFLYGWSDPDQCISDLESWLGEEIAQECCAEESCCVCSGKSVIKSYTSCDPPPPPPPCLPVDGGDCFASPGYPDQYYPDNADCVYTMTKTGILSVMAFDTEECCDFLTFPDGTQFSGSSPAGLDGYAVTVDDEVTFTSDGSGVLSGFRICIV